MQQDTVQLGLEAIVEFRNSSLAAREYYQVATGPHYTNVLKASGHANFLNDKKAQWGEYTCQTTEER